MRTFAGLFFILLTLTIQKAFPGLPPTTTKGSNDASDVTTFKFLFPNVTFTHIGTSATFGTVGVPSGGTGATSLAENSVLLGNGTAAVQLVAPGTSGNMLVSNGTTWTSTPATGSTLVTSVGATSPDIQSVYFGAGADCATVCSTGNCTICSRTGNKITGIAWVANGDYRMSGLDNSKYSCTGNGHSVGSSNKPIIQDRPNAVGNATTIRLFVDTFNVGFATVHCIGVP